ncbi:hypothetical protein [Sphingobium tyrosinilyticum]|uniref:Spore coat protein U domain-containing protein n=1 Tax=Sphingobium tyrosinilyticum TaxID=2715436 RepID=A0ABV9EZ22_9SPHN
MGARFQGAMVACALAFSASAPAKAQSLTITATGTIVGGCGITVGSNFGPANLSAGGNVTGTATVNCNAGFKINATSANGAIKTNTVAPANFTNAVPYSLAMTVPLDVGGNVSATCNSSELVAGQSGCALSPGNSAGLSSNGKTANNKTATLTASWSLPAPRLIAGTYSDTITVSIASVP